MKKKIFALLCAVIACLGMLFAFTACDSASGNMLQMEKKYNISYTGSEVQSQSYYVFHSDGTGEYYHYRNSASTLLGYRKYQYTVHFKYTFVDSEKEAVVCFYDSVEYGDLNQDGVINSDWDSLLTVSENVLCYASSGGYTFYVCEDYLPQIPNYNS